jgi:hypothetical protein
MNLYSLISNYETCNKYTKHLNTCAYLFNVVATIIRIRGLRILCIKHFKVNREQLIIICVKHCKVNRGFIIIFLVLGRSTDVGGVYG